MSAFCSGLCNEISRCCYDFYHAPFTKKNLLIGGGVMFGLIILIIIIVLASGAGYHKETTAEDLLKEYPLVDGANSLSKNIKDMYMNQLNNIKNGLFTTGALNCNACQTDFNRLTQGHVASQVFSVTTDCTAEYKDAVSQTLEQIDLMKRIIASNNTKLALVKEAVDITKLFSNGKTGVIISVWGGHNIDSKLAVLRMYYDLGVRIMSIVSADPEHTEHFTCVPPWANGTISDFGKEVVKEMNRLGMIIDLTGCSPGLQDSILAVTTAPVIFSHSGSATLNQNPLNVHDTILNKYKEKIGIVMVPFTPSQLSDNNSTVNSVAEHLDQFYTILGQTTKLGIGSNFDNMTELTKGLEDVSKFKNLISYLKSRTTPKGKIGWTNSELEYLISNNFIQAFKSVEKASNIHGKAAEDIIPRQEIEANDQCYTDFKIRYNPNIPTAAPTTSTTTPTKATPKTTSTTAKTKSR